MPRSRISHMLFLLYMGRPGTGSQADGRCRFMESSGIFRLRGPVGRRTEQLAIWGYGQLWSHLRFRRAVRSGYVENLQEQKRETTGISAGDGCRPISGRFAPISQDVPAVSIIGFHCLCVNTYSGGVFYEIQTC